jgi:hypothetical protein
MRVRPDAPMMFGKHKGKPLRELSEDYLRWLDRNVKLTGWLRETVRWLLRHHDRAKTAQDAKALIAAMQDQAWHDWEVWRQRKQKDGSSSEPAS